MLWYGLGIQRILEIVIMLLYKGSGDDIGFSQNHLVHSLCETKYCKEKCEVNELVFLFISI